MLNQQARTFNRRTGCLLLEMLGHFELNKSQNVFFHFYKSISALCT